MRRILSIAVLVFVIFGVCAAAEGVAEYSSRNILCVNDIVYSLTYCDGMLYGLFESGLYKVDPLGEKTLVASSADFQPGIAAILTDNQSVYATACEEDKAFLLKLTDEDGAYVNERILTMDYKPGMDITHTILRDGFLYYSVRDYLSSEAMVIRVNVSDGTESSVAIEDLVCFDVMDNGDLFAETRKARWPEDIVLLQTASRTTGMLSPWAEISDDEYASELIFDSRSDTAYLLANREVSMIQGDGQLIPTGLSFSEDIVDLCLLPNGLAATSGEMLKICSLDDTPEQKIVLSVCGLYAEDEYFTSFYQSHPTVEIRQVQALSEEPEERYIRDVLTQNPEVDLYVLHDLNMLSVIKSKGYYADLSQSETIREKVKRMYAPFIQALTDGDKTAAFPHPYYVMFTSLSYNKAVFEKLNLSVPTTWDEYFDFCLDWKDEYEDKNPGISVNPFEHDLSLVTLLEHYDDEMSRDGISADYQSEALESVLRKYLSVKERYSVYDDFGTPLFYDYDLSTSSGKSSEYEALPLTFVKGADPIYTPMEEDVYYFVVNPYGTHVQEAIECVASAMDRNRSNEPYIYTEIPDLPLENIYYEEALRMYQEQLDMLEKQKQNAEADADSLLSIHERIERLTEEKQNYAENMRYWFTEDDMAPFREIAGHVYFSDFNPVKAVYADDPDFFDNVTDANLDVFLRALNAKVKMVRMEEE